MELPYTRNYPKRYAQAHQVRRKSRDCGRRSRLVRLRQTQPNQPEPVVHAGLVRQAAAEELREAEAATRLAARDRFAVPALRPGNPAADCGRQVAARDPAQ